MLWSKHRQWSPLLFSLVGLGLMGARQTPAPSDPILDLAQRIEKNDAKLEFEPGHGYLKTILRELKIDPSSQVLVFSKSSLQTEFITPKTPRAIYFNDHTYVGWIPGAPLIEIASVDPVNGVKFYTLPNHEASIPTFKTETRTCFPCHGGSNLVARSSPTTPAGYARPFSPTYSVTPSTPLRQRWGGWYVTGLHGVQRHMGNEFSVGDDQSNAIDIEKGANVTKLDRYFDTKAYLTPHSDIVALMVMEHQMAVQNVIYQTSLRAAYASGSELSRLADTLVGSLLCRNDAPLYGPIKGTSSFVSVYQGSAPKDSSGRSLAEFDLKERLYKYSCSPLIYSESFTKLPAPLKAQVWQRLKEILTDIDASGNYDYLSKPTKQALLGILQETLPEFGQSLKG